jgi:hypothetical protein
MARYSRTLPIVWRSFDFGDNNAEVVMMLGVLLCTARLQDDEYDGNDQ